MVLTSHVCYILTVFIEILVIIFKLTEYRMSCNLTFTLQPNSAQRQYKTFTIPDNDFLNEDVQTKVNLSLASTDRNVMFVQDRSSAIIVVVDNESKLII